MPIFGYAQPWAIGLQFACFTRQFKFVRLYPKIFLQEVHFSYDFPVVIPIWWKIRFAGIPFLAIISLQTFAHAYISWNVHKFGAIALIEFGRSETKFSSNLNYGGKLLVFILTTILVKNDQYDACRIRVAPITRYNALLIYPVYFLQITHERHPFLNRWGEVWLSFVSS